MAGPDWEDFVCAGGTIVVDFSVNSYLKFLDRRLHFFGGSDLNLLGLQSFHYRAPTYSGLALPTT